MWVAEDYSEEIALGDIRVTVNGVPGMSKNFFSPLCGHKLLRNPKTEVTLHLLYLSVSGQRAKGENMNLLFLLMVIIPETPL